VSAQEATSAASRSLSLGAGDLGFSHSITPPTAATDTIEPPTAAPGCDLYPGRHWYRHAYHDDCKSYYFLTP
jgi:hypothetical protein